MPPLCKQRKQVVPTTEQRQRAAARQEAERIRQIERDGWLRFAKAIDPDADGSTQVDKRTTHH